MILAVLFILAFLPMIGLVYLIRNSEHHQKQSWLSLGIVFLWGVLIASTMAVVLETFIQQYVLSYFFLVVIVAPIVEEFSKPLGMRLVKKDVREVEDGFIYGAVAGLGFAATENLLYGIRFVDEGFIVLFALFYLRTLGSGLLHASATAFTGYGYSMALLHKRSFGSILPMFFSAILMHGFYNICTITTILSSQICGIVFAVVFSVSLFSWMRRKIRYYDLHRPYVYSLVSAQK